MVKYIEIGGVIGNAIMSNDDDSMRVSVLETHHEGSEHMKEVCDNIID